jgi:hypothetical protein
MPKTKISLRDILNNEIKRTGYLSIDRMEAICKENHYKISNGERRLRPSDSPDVEGINKFGQVAESSEPIVGYRMKQKEQKLFDLPEEQRGPNMDGD